MVAFLLVGILTDWQAGEVAGKHAGLFVLAAVLQAGAMVLFIMFS
jgi:hypothetical protein